MHSAETVPVDDYNTHQVVYSSSELEAINRPGCPTSHSFSKELATQHALIINTGRTWLFHKAFQLGTTISTL